MGSQMPLSHRRIWALALPLMLANLSTPLVGLVDTAVVGQLGRPLDIGAVALGSIIFIFLFWAFGFLRMGTTGLTAQALGAGDTQEMLAGLLRALLVGLICGLALIALQWPVGEAAFYLLDVSPSLEALGRQYYQIRVWAAPATFANYALLGWFVGRGQTRIALALQLLLNLSNVIFDALFVLVFNWGVAGVAAGSVMAEMLAAVSGLVVAWRYVGGAVQMPAVATVLDRQLIRRMVAVNSDIMIRSLALIAVFSWFVRAGAQQGELVFAANSVLIHLVSSGAYFLDGFAHTAETLVGQAVGRGDQSGFRRAVKLTTAWAALVALMLTALIAVAGGAAVDVITIDPATRAVAREFLPWVACAPLLGVWSFQLDGIFIGATRSAEMRKAMLWSLVLFAGAWWSLRGWGNHGLWMSLSFHYLARAATLYCYYPGLVRGLTSARQQKY